MGSRLEPLTYTVPKPMVPVVNRPVMEYIVQLLKSHGVSDVVANLYYLPEVIHKYFDDGQKFGINMHYSREKELLGTAGGVKNNQRFLDETFVVISGDALTDIDLTALYNYHKEKKALATIALKEVADVSRFGVVAVDERGKILRFQEKPRPEEAISNLANTGIYMFEPEVFDYIPAGTFSDFGRDIFPLLAERELPFYGFNAGCYWSDIGTIESYTRGNFDLLTGKVNLTAAGSTAFASIHPGAVVEAPDAITGPVYIGRGTLIRRGAKIIGPAIIGNHCQIDPGAVIDKSIIWSGTKAGLNSRLSGCVVAFNNVIGENVTVRQGAVLGSGCILSEEAVGPGTLVWPDRTGVSKHYA